ncbi:ATP-grasp domain-containing protein [Mammaliicoccus sciuri]|uniref:ATP-grasp domain-containing protein n=1 Tax=Mammaliicoccus sciuri TaxID=1296 RepID=UPI003F56F6E1
MSILIYNSSKYEYTPITNDWFKDVQDTIVLFTPEKNYDSYKHLESNNIHIITFKNWRENWEIEFKAIELHSIYKFTKIITFRENDIIRSAYLRELLNIPGQSIESAQFFRDKFIMKSHLKRNDILTPHFSNIKSFSDIYLFIKKNNYPVIIKPRLGAGSVNTFVIKNEEELFYFFRNELRTFNLNELIIEEFIEGDVYHIDGIVNKGRPLIISPSKYINNCLQFKNGSSTCSVMLDESNKLYSQLIEYTENLLSKIVKTDVYIFHLEVFISNSEIIFCEIASRAGGGEIEFCISKKYGIYLNKELFSLAVSGKLNSSIKYNDNIKSMGWLLSSPKSGLLKTIPESIPFKFIEKYNSMSQVGTTFNIAKSSVHAIASFACSGNSEADVTDNILKLDHWFKSRCIYN